MEPVSATTSHPFTSRLMTTGARRRVVSYRNVIKRRARTRKLGHPENAEELLW